MNALMPGMPQDQQLVNDPGHGWDPALHQTANASSGDPAVPASRGVDAPTRVGGATRERTRQPAPRHARVPIFIGKTGWYAACSRGCPEDAFAGPVEQPAASEYADEITMFRLSWRSRRWRAILALALTAPLLAFAFVAWRASRARKEAAEAVLAKSQFPFRVVAIDRALPAGADLLSAAPEFRDIAAFRDTIAVSGRAGLFVYSRDGSLLRVYRSGFELPPAELGSMAEGIAAGSAEPELFIATRGEGLLAFNGARFRQILPEDAALRNITCALVLGSGRILLGTERRGLLVFDGRSLAPFHARLETAHITALAGSEGDLWIGTLAEGAFHYRAGQLQNLLSALPDPQVLSLAWKDDAVFVGTPLGAVEFREGAPPRPIAEGFFAQAMAAADDLLHVGTEDEGIVDVPLGSRPRSAIPGEDAASVPILRMRNLEGRAYAVAASAIYRYEPALKHWQPALRPENPLLTDRDVAALALTGGDLWVGYFDRGLDIVNALVDAGPEHARHLENDALFCVNRIVPDPGHARTAVATANGLVLFDSAGRPRQILGAKDGLLSEHITDVAFRTGGMVVATPAGLSFVDSSGVRSLYVFQGLVNNHVYTVATRGDETLAGTLGGVSVLDGDTVRVNYTTANSRLKHNWITAVAQVAGEWFAGTYGAGVLRLDAAGEWHGFPDLPAGFIVNPNAMLVTPNRVYAGSLGHGLFIFDRATGRWSNTAQALPSKNVTALAAGDGYLYIGTDNGLVRMPEGALR